MVYRKTPHIPERTIIGLRDLIEKGWTDDAISKYYGVDRSTITRRRNKLS